MRRFLSLKVTISEILRRVICTYVYISTGSLPWQKMFITMQYHLFQNKLLEKNSVGHIELTFHVLMCLNHVVMFLQFHFILVEVVRVLFNFLQKFKRIIAIMGRNISQCMHLLQHYSCFY